MGWVKFNLNMENPSIRLPFKKKKLSHEKVVFHAVSHMSGKSGLIFILLLTANEALITWLLPWGIYWRFSGI